MWAALFPGQGSQHSGMGKFLFDEFATARQTFEEASDSLSLDFKKLCFEGSESDLALTHNTQPCLLLVSTVYDRVLKEISEFKPLAGSGHSVGEYAAVVSAGAMKFSDAMRAVRRRGEAMQSAVPVGKGAMLAVMGLTPEQVRKVCSWVETNSGFKPLEPANFNAPGQVVVSGSAEAITWLQSHFDPSVLAPDQVRAKFIPLKVSAPFHCSLMKPAESEMEKVLGEIDFQDARFPIVQNVDAQPHTDGLELRSNLVRQVSASVLWTDCVSQLKEMGVRKVIELGSGKVISGLVKKIDSQNLTTFNMNSLEELKAVEQALKD